MRMFETVLKTSDIVLCDDKILGTIWDFWVPFGVPRNPWNWLIFCKNTQICMISIENGIIPWYPMVPKSFFSKSMMSNVFKTLLQSIIPLFSQFLRLYGKYHNLKIEKTHFLKYQEKIGRNFVVNCSIMIWRFRWMMSTQWSFYRPSFEWYPKLPSFSFLSIFKSVTFFETHNFFLMSEKVPLMVPKTSEISIIKKFELWTF